MTKPPAPKPGPAGRKISRAENELWRQVTGDMEPLVPDGAPDGGPDGGHASGPSADTSPESDSGPEDGGQEDGGPAKKKAAGIKPAIAPPSLPVGLPAATGGGRGDPDLTHGRAPGLDRRTQTRMRRGQIDIEARIDLHGMTQEQAHRALHAFLKGSRDADRRAVLVITGKGRGSGEGVLRDAVPRWLNEDSIRPMIRAFSHAAPKHGGQGALYVLLKRRK